jgi:hypothetical protein
MVPPLFRRSAAWYWGSLRTHGWRRGLYSFAAPRLELPTRAVACSGRRLARDTLAVVHSVSNQTECRIALVRHGRSSHVHAGWINAAGFRAWRESYESAGILENERVPSHLEQLAECAGLVLASDASRAIASARLLAPGREVIVSRLLRELDLRGPDLDAIRLPLVGWALAVGVRNLLLTLRRQYPPAAEVDRVSEAAGWLEGLAVRHSLIVVVTHASFRQRLARRLVQTGWKAEQGRRSLRHWSAWIFRRD